MQLMLQKLQAHFHACHSTRYSDRQPRPNAQPTQWHCPTFCRSKIPGSMDRPQTPFPVPRGAHNLQRNHLAHAIRETRLPKERNHHVSHTNTVQTDAPPRHAVHSQHMDQAPMYHPGLKENLQLHRHHSPTEPHPLTSMHYSHWSTTQHPIRLHGSSPEHRPIPPHCQTTNHARGHLTMHPPIHAPPLPPHLESHEMGQMPPKPSP